MGNDAEGIMAPRSSLPPGSQLLREREYRQMPWDELRNWERYYQRADVLAAEDVAKSDPHLMPSEALALTEDHRAYASYNLSVIQAEIARRRRAVVRGVPREGQRFDDDLLDRIREGIGIDVLATEELGTVLDKHGRGPCPWCGGSQYSGRFAAYTKSGRVVCYSCGFAADAFGIVQSARQLSFPEAVRVLAERVGVNLPGGTEARHG